MSRRRNRASSSLRYVGPAPVGGVVPLPEGWPALDHEEPDASLRAKKLSSGMYESSTSAATEAAAEE